MENQINQKKSFWSYGIGKVLRSIFVIAIVWGPIYLCSNLYGETGFKGALFGEIGLFVLVALILKAIKNRKTRPE